MTLNDHSGEMSKCPWEKAAEYPPQEDGLMEDVSGDGPPRGPQPSAAVSREEEPKVSHVKQNTAIRRRRRQRLRCDCF